MAENSEISWTHHTFNVVWGCTKVSPECQHCYAETWAKRCGVGWGPAAPRKVMSASYWRQPLKWGKAAAAAGERHRVFCSSMADVFEDHPTVEAERARLWDLIDATPNLDWLLLTKRPENIARMMPVPECGSNYHIKGPALRLEVYRPNVWLGTTVGVRGSLPRIDALRSIPAAVRFLSCEPLLEDLGTVDLSGIGWLICGGESGPRARPMHPLWARSLRDQCQAAGVAFHFKQWGEHGLEQIGPVRFTPVASGVPMGEPQAMFRVGKKAAGRLLDGRTWDEFPEPAVPA